MRKIYITLLVLLLVMVPMAAIFLYITASGGTPSANDESVAEATQYPFKLTMSLNKTEFTLGEPVNITIEIVNISNSTIKLEWTSPSLAMFTVYDRQNRKIYNSAKETMLPMVVVKELKPGGRWEVPQVIGDETPAIWSQRDDEGRQVPAGTYHIIAEIPPRLYSSLGVYELVNGEWILINLLLHVKTPALIITIS